MTHSPLPWEVNGDQPEMVESTVAGVLIATLSTAEDFPCLDDDQVDEVNAETKANAKLICTAVNNHATLLSALESLLGAQITINWDATELECLSCANRHVGDVFPLEKHDPPQPCGRAAAALKQAKGEA